MVLSRKSASKGMVLSRKSVPVRVGCSQTCAREGRGLGCRPSGGVYFLAD